MTAVQHREIKCKRGEMQLRGVTKKGRICYSEHMKLHFILILVFVCLSTLGAQVPKAGTIEYPESYYTFRDNMLNSEGITAEEFEDEYLLIIKEIMNTTTGLEQEVLLARCDYVLGRAYRYLSMNKKAAECFDRAIETCEKILKMEEMVEAYVVYADSVSQNCAVKSKGYAMMQGSKIKSMAKKALKLDPTYGAAKYLENSQNIFTPAPFNNYEEGMKVLDTLLDTNQFRMDKSDRYSALSARAYGYLQQGMKEEALYWYNKALEIYPRNVAVLEILPTIKQDCLDLCHDNT